MNHKIYGEVEALRSQYENGTVDVMEGLPFSQKRQLRVSEFYSNSKYMSGNRDALGRDIPFYNIVNFRVTLAKVATDLDTKDMQVTSDNPSDRVRSMLLGRELYEWMKAEDFAYTLNKSGYYRPKYGGVMVKTTVEKEDGEDEEICVDVVEWKNIITDQVDIDGGPKVEYHFMSPYDLSKKQGAWDNVTEVMKLSKGGSKKKRNALGESAYSSDRITILEVNGIFSDATLKDAKGEEISEEDEWTFSRQKYFIYGDGDKQIILYAETCDEDPYDYLPWEEMSGRGLGRGVIEDAEEAQVWTNDSVVNEKQAMDLAGKVLLKTTAKGMASNVLEVDNGKIFELGMGTDLNALNLAPSALGQFQNQISKWETQVSRATSSYDANTGEQPPANTPYSQTALLNQVASKPFDYRREEAGIFWSDLIMERIIPFLINKISAKHILASEFSTQELEVIDDSFSKFHANKRAIQAVISGKIVTAEEYQSFVDGYRELLGSTNRRFVEIPEGYFDGIEAKVSINPTNESRDKAATLASLAQIMKDISATYNPQTGTFAALENPVLSTIMGNIVEAAGTGLSPVSLGIGKSAKAQPQLPAKPAAPATPVAA
jgi:hypothetical protein